MQLFSLLLTKYKYIGGLAWFSEAYNTLSPILYSILAVVGTSGAIYAIVLGVNLAKSENDEKRKAAIARLRNTIIGVCVLLILVLFINLGLEEILHVAFPDEVVTPDKTTESAKTIINTILSFKL